MADTSKGPVFGLVSRTPATMVAEWSSLQTAAGAASELALRPGLDDVRGERVALVLLMEAASQKAIGMFGQDDPNIAVLLTIVGLLLPLLRPWTGFTIDPLLVNWVLR